LWLPFGVKSVKAVFNYYSDLGRNFWCDSIPYAVHFVLTKSGFMLSKQAVGNFFFFLFIVSYVCIIGYFLKKSEKDKQAIFTALSLVLLALLFTNSTPFQAWYLIWVIPFILLSNIRIKFQIAFLLSYFLIMTFWKRMCVLAVPMFAAYLFIRAVYKRYNYRIPSKNA
jgi:hypothetical protein